MRRDKATLDFGGETMAARIGRALRQVAYPVLAVGPAAGSDLEQVEDPREGPLKAFVAGADALRARGHDGPILLLACDVPFVEPGFLAHLVRSLGDADAIVPYVRGRDQSLVACYSQAAVALARWLVADGADALRDLLRIIDVRRLREEEFDHIWPAWMLADLDSPGALLRARMLLRTQSR